MMEENTCGLGFDIAGKPIEPGPYLYVDPAKPSWAEGVHPVFPGTLVYIDRAKPAVFGAWSQVQEVRDWTIGEPLPGLDAINEKHRTDRIWDLLVLAAESSRYGDR